MKKFTALFVIFFLFTFVKTSFAADIKLQDTSSSIEKSIAVSINTKEEATENVKIVIENTSNVTITDVIESDISCSTFSYVPSQNKSEIICILPSSQPAQGLIAKILFTSTSEDYKFTIVEKESQVGDLTIENVSNVGLDRQPITSEEEKDSSMPSTTTQAPTSTTNTIMAKKDNKIMAYSPYILLGVAGIFLISIIVLLITKKKEDVVLTDLPASTMPQQLIQQPVQQPAQQPVDFENIPQNLQNETMQDNIPTPKPTLAEIVNQQTPADSIMNPAPVTTNEQEDLEVLLRSENPSMVTNNSMPEVENTTNQNIETSPTVNELPENISEDIPQVGNTTIEQQQPIQNAEINPISNGVPEYYANENTTTEQQPIQNTETSSTSNGLLDNYSANVSEGGLPEVGSTSPLETPMEENTVNTQTEMNNTISPSLEPMGQTTETITQPEVTTSMDTDLQNSVNMEINNISQNMTNIPTDNTQQNPTEPIEQA